MTTFSSFYFFTLCIFLLLTQSQSQPFLPHFLSHSSQDCLLYLRFPQNSPSHLLSTFPQESQDFPFVSFIIRTKYYRHEILIESGKSGQEYSLLPLKPVKFSNSPCSLVFTPMDPYFLVESTFLFYYQITNPSGIIVFVSDNHNFSLEKNP